MIKRLLDFRLLVLIAILSVPALAWSVTQKEMEQARTIAAKSYIRYANDGSGYLDELNPKTMEELEAALKPKEKENIKAFKAIPVPTDYKNWGKEQLVEYWAVKAFQDKGLLEKGRGGRIRARTQINKMTIAPPQPETPAQPAATPAPVDSASKAQTPEITPQLPNEQALTEDEINDELNIDKATNYTWVYIMILGILVAVVVVLVVYAANVFKKNGSSSPVHQREEDDEEIEHYQSMVADKDVEISMLKKKLDSLTKQNIDLKNQLEAASKELSILKSTHQSQVTVAPSVAEVKHQEANPQPQKRAIFLGRANMRGIFVRADRTLNIGNSVFLLETTDGFSGTFRVADSPAAWSLALSNPKEYLETACTGHDLDDTADASKIVTESAGTAVFEGGCWRVIRKAKIKYE